MTQSINVPDEVVAALTKIAGSKGVSVSRALIDAVSLELAVDSVRADGGRVLVEKGGHVRELVKGRG